MTALFVGQCTFLHLEPQCTNNVSLVELYIVGPFRSRSWRSCTNNRLIQLATKQSVSCNQRKCPPAESRPSRRCQSDECCTRNQTLPVNTQINRKQHARIIRLAYVSVGYIVVHLTISLAVAYAERRIGTRRIKSDLVLCYSIYCWW